MRLEMKIKSLFHLLWIKTKSDIFLKHLKLLNKDLKKLVTLQAPPPPVSNTHTPGCSDENQYLRDPIYFYFLSSASYFIANKVRQVGQRHFQ